MRIVGSNGHYMRLIDDYLDRDFFIQCMKTWPDDHMGPFTVKRCEAVLSKHFKQSRLFHFPLTEDSQYNLTMVYCLEDNTQVAYRRNKVKGTTHHIGQEVVHPDHRGKRYARMMMRPWMIIARDLQQAEEVTLEIMESATALMHMIESYDVEIIGERIGVTGQKLIKFRVSMDMYKIYIASNKGAKDRMVIWTYEE